MLHTSRVDPHVIAVTPAVVNDAVVECAIYTPDVHTCTTGKRENNVIQQQAACPCSRDRR